MRPALFLIAFWILCVSVHPLVAQSKPASGKTYDQKKRVKPKKNVFDIFVHIPDSVNRQIAKFEAKQWHVSDNKDWLEKVYAVENMLTPGKQDFVNGIYTYRDLLNPHVHMGLLIYHNGKVTLFEHIDSMKILSEYMTFLETTSLPYPTQTKYLKEISDFLESKRQEIEYWLKHQ